jgi:hypothetical protein
MSIHGESTASRRFVASSEAFSSIWIKGTTIWQVGYTLFFAAFVAVALLAVLGPSFGIHVHVPHNSGVVFLEVLAAMRSPSVIAVMSIHSPTRNWVSG